MASMENAYSLTLISRAAGAIERFFWSFWWVCLVMITSLVVLEQGLKSLKENHAQLHQQLALMMKERDKALALRDNLKLQINSQSDPAWVELTLKKELGLVPEGHTKVLFIKEK